MSFLNITLIMTCHYLSDIAPILRNQLHYLFAFKSSDIKLRRTMLHEEYDKLKNYECVVYRYKDESSSIFKLNLF